MSVERILIVNLTRLGDLLQTSPTVAGLRARHPHAEITLLAERNFADVCEAIPGVDRVERLDLDRLGHLLLAGGERIGEAFHVVRDTIAELRARRFDLALNFSSSRMSAIFLGLLDVSDVRGWSMTPDGHRAIRTAWARLFATLCLNRRVAGLNLVDCYRGIAGCLEGGPRRLLYAVPDGARQAVAARLAEAGVAPDRPLVALQLGASRAVRRWPTDAFARLADALHADGTTPVLIGGAGERELADEVRGAQRAGARAVDLCGRTSVGELGALLERCRALVTGDTGPMHMAAAVGTPIVGLFFGPAMPFDTGPYGADHVLLHASVACAPCDHSARCLAPFCRTVIGPELVAAAVRARLADDWRALETLARAAAPVRAYRTTFDVHGLHECRVLGDAAPRPEDALRLAYRATWLALLEGRALPAPRAASAPVDLAPFAAAAELGRVGRELATRLASAAARGPTALDEVQRLGREVEALDRAIVEHGRVHPDTAVLTQMFAFEKEAVEGDGVVELARGWARLYAQLTRSADCVRQLLGEPARREERDHADLRQ